MLDKINHHYDRIKPSLIKLYKTLHTPLIKFSILSFVVIITVYYVITQYNALQNSIKGINLNYQAIFLSSIIVVLTICFSVLSWVLIIKALGFNILIIETAYIQLLSSLGKYIPGHIWNFSGRIILSKKFGLPLKFSSISIFIELVFHYFLGLLISIIFFPAEIIMINRSLLVSLKIILILLLTTIVFIIIYFVKKKILINTKLNVILLLFAFTLRLLIWYFSSYAFIILLISIGLPQINISTALSVISTSYVGGFVAFITPDGILVREVIFSFFLRNYISQPDAVISSVLLRFQMIVSELFSIGIVLLSMVFFRKKQEI